MEMRKKTVAMTMVNGKIVDNYEDRSEYGVGLVNKAVNGYRKLKLMEDAMVTYRLIRAPEIKVLTIASQNLGEVDDVTYFKNKMLQGLGISKDINPCL